MFQSTRNPTDPHLSSQSSRLNAQSFQIIDMIAIRENRIYSEVRKQPGPCREVFMGGISLCLPRLTREIDDDHSVGGTCFYRLTNRRDKQMR